MRMHGLRLQANYTSLNRTDRYGDAKGFNKTPDQSAADPRPEMTCHGREQT